MSRKPELTFSKAYRMLGTWHFNEKEIFKINLFYINFVKLWKAFVIIFNDHNAICYFQFLLTFLLIILLRWLECLNVLLSYSILNCAVLYCMELNATVLYFIMVYCIIYVIRHHVTLKRRELIECILCLQQSWFND